MSNVQALQEQVNLQLLSDLMNCIVGTSNNLNAKKYKNRYNFLLNYIDFN